MAETDVLNPVQGYYAPIDDNSNPSYGFTRKTASNSQLSRTRMGAWNQRDNANAGYSFAMSYLNRPWKTMLRLKQFYEIGKRGYFTYIDYDGGGRHHVGRFTSEPNPVEVANGKYNCQNLIFEEVPQARMLTYPADSQDWGAFINVLDDHLRLAVSFQGTWTLRLRPPGIGYSPTDPSAYELWNQTPTVTDFAQIQYVGWGFSLYLDQNSAGGKCNILLDGQVIVQGLDLYDGTYVALNGYNFINPVAPFAPISLPATAPATVIYVDVSSQFFIQMYGVPLDAHRLKIVPLATKNALSTGYEVTFETIRVIV